MLKCSMGSSLSIPEECWGGDYSASESCTTRDAGAGEGWGVVEAVAVWEQGVFLMLELALASLSRWPG